MKVMSGNQLNPSRRRPDILEPVAPQRGRAHYVLNVLVARYFWMAREQAMKIASSRALFFRGRHGAD
jgi:hypothetical protein